MPGLTAQNWGSPCKRLPSQTPPRTRPQPPSLWSPERSRRRLCSCCSAHEILMRERLAGGGAPPPARAPAPRSRLPPPPPLQPPAAFPPPPPGGPSPRGGGERAAAPAAQKGEPGLPHRRPRRCHGNACPAGLGPPSARMERGARPRAREPSPEPGAITGPGTLVLEHQDASPAWPQRMFRN